MDEARALAALREENARLHLEIKGNAITRNELRADLAQAEAHVGALVKAWTDFQATPGWDDDAKQTFEDRMLALANSPDLTAIVERTRTRDAVVEAARAVVAADSYPHPMLSRADAVKAGVMQLHDAVNALAALDATRGR